MLNGGLLLVLVAVLDPEAAEVPVVLPVSVVLVDPTTAPVVEGLAEGAEMVKESAETPLRFPAASLERTPKVCDPTVRVFEEV